MGHWISACISIYLIYMFKVKVCSQIGHHDFHRGFCECLTEAYSSATAKRCPRERMSLLPVRSEEERVILIKPLREELSWSLPVVTIVVKGIHMNDYLSAGLDLIFSNFAVFLQVKR